MTKRQTKQEKRKESVHHFRNTARCQQSYTGDERQKQELRKEAVSVSRLMQRVQAADKTVGEYIRLVSRLVDSLQPVQEVTCRVEPKRERQRGLFNLGVREAVMWPQVCSMDGKTNTDIYVIFLFF